MRRQWRDTEAECFGSTRASFPSDWLSQWLPPGLQPSSTVPFAENRRLKSLFLSFIKPSTLLLAGKLYRVCCCFMPAPQEHARPHRLGKRCRPSAWHDLTPAIAALGSRSCFAAPPQETDHRSSIESWATSPGVPSQRLCLLPLRRVARYPGRSPSQPALSCAPHDSCGAFAMPGPIGSEAQSKFNGLARAVQQYSSCPSAVIGNLYKDNVNLTDRTLEMLCVRYREGVLIR